MTQKLMFQIIKETIFKRRKDFGSDRFERLKTNNNKFNLSVSVGNNEKSKQGIVSLYTSFLSLQLEIS